MQTVLTFLIILIFSHSAFAVKILSIKKDKVLLDLESDNVNIGDKIGLRDLQKKPKGILQITKIQNGKAIASVKGEVQKDFVLEILNSKKSLPTTSSSDQNTDVKISDLKNPKTDKSSLKKQDTKPSRKKSLSDYYGFTAGYSLNSMTVKPSSSSSIKLSARALIYQAFTKEASRQI